MKNNILKYFILLLSVFVVLTIYLSTVGIETDKFNGQMKFAVDQSNAQWRRQINTTNTATQNETNRINVQNTYNASQAAQNFLWQKMRDNAQFNFQKNEP